MGVGRYGIVWDISQPTVPSPSPPQVLYSTCHSTGTLPYHPPGYWLVFPVQEETTYLLSITDKNLPIGNKTCPRQVKVHWTYSMTREMSCHYKTGMLSLCLYGEACLPTALLTTTSTAVLHHTFEI